MAIIIGGFKQETNSFCAVPMTLEDFRQGYLYCGDEIIEHLTGSKTGEGGFIDVLKREDKKIAPALSAMPAASSGGVATADTYHYLRDELLKRVEAYYEQGDVEAVLLNMHGAMIAEDCDDVEGFVAEAVRKIVGTQIPIGVSLDGHAYVSEKLLDNADIIVGYATFPHVDEYGTGYRAAELIIKMLKGELVPTKETVEMPMLLSPEAELDSQFPLADILGMCREAEKVDGVESVTFFPVQPWMDIENLISRVLVITNQDFDLAKEKAVEIGKKAWALRHDFVSEHLLPNEAVRAAMKAPEGPVIISEVGDAPPAGAPGDSNCLLKALLEEAPQEPAYVTVIDAEAVEQACQAGEGNTVKMGVGYKLDDRWGRPIEIEGKVNKLLIGEFRSQQIGTIVNMGRTAIVQIGKVSLVVCENAFNHLDPNSYRALGLDPEQAKIVGVKSTQHFRAFYQDIAKEIYLLDMDGPSSSEFKRFDWKHLSRPMWPLDEMDEELL